MNETAAVAASALATAVKGVSFTGITAELTGVLPVVLPVLVTVLALRKGISFLLGTLRGC